MDIVYKRIKELRKELNMTQEELAQQLGYDRSSISKIEKGLVDLSIDKVFEFSQALHCNPSYLMGWIDNPDCDGLDNINIPEYENTFCGNEPQEDNIYNKKIEKLTEMAQSLTSEQLEALISMIRVFV